MRAICWISPEDCEDVVLVHPQIVYSTNRTHYYVLHPQIRAEEWLPVDEDAPGQDGKPVPFSDRILDAGDNVPVFGELDEKEFDLVERQVERVGLFMSDLRTFGLLRNENGEWVTVRSGDWLIRQKGQWNVVRDDDPYRITG